MPFSGSTDVYVLFEPSPVRIIDSVTWAILRGRLAGRKVKDVALRLADAAMLLTGEQFHALFVLRWNLSQHLFFGGLLTRWTVAHALQLALPLRLEPAVLLEEYDSGMRSAQLMSVALHFIVDYLLKMRSGTPHLQ